MSTLPRWKKHPSGLETILIAKRDNPIVKINIVLPYGSYEDPVGKEGLLNFVGDMLLRGTKSKSRDEIEFTLDHLGASLNVYSGHHSLVIEGKVLAKNLQPLVEMMKEVITSPAFGVAEIQKLKNEIKADLLLRLEDDQDLAKHHFFKSIYANHLYARDVVGTAASMDAIADSDLSKTYETYFNRTGMLIGASGDLSDDQFEKTANELYEVFRPSSALITKKPFQSTISGKEILLIDKPGLTQTQFFVGHPGIRATHEDLIPLDVFVTAFAGGMFQAKYMQEIRVKRGWSYGAYGSLDTRRDGGSFYLYTFPKNDDTVDAIALTLELLEQAVEGTLVREDAVQFAKNSLSRSYPFKVDTPDKVLSQKIYYKLIGKDENELEQYRQKVQAVDFAAALKKAQTHLHPRDLKVVMVCTASLFEEKLAKRLNPKNITIKKYTEAT